MGRYLALRFVQIIAVLWAVATIVFLLGHVVGDPIALLLPPEAGNNEELRRTYERQFGLDQPLIVQYRTYLWNLLQGDVGQSYRWRQPGFDVVIDKIPATLKLSGAALLFGTTVGLVIGVASAYFAGGIIDRLGMSIVLFGQAVPVFWLGIVLITFFAVKWQIFPVAGPGGLDHLALPAITLGTYLMAPIARLTRTSVLEVLHQDYILLARLKGLPERTVVFKHALKNAALPIITIIALQFGTIIAGAVVTERVFAWPGAGQLIVDSVQNRDFAVVQAAVLLAAAAIAVMNLGLDFVYAYIDPRIRLART